MFQETSPLVVFLHPHNEGGHRSNREKSGSTVRQFAVGIHVKSSRPLALDKNSGFHLRNRKGSSHTAGAELNVALPRLGRTRLPPLDLRGNRNREDVAIEHPRWLEGGLVQGTKRSVIDGSRMKQSQSQTKQ